MKYTKLGNTDITVSQICVGGMSFGKAFDCYTPDADTPTKNICNMISRKTKTQATRIVLNLDLKDKIEIKNVLEQVFAKTYDGDLKAMDELIVVYQGEIIWHFVR